MKRGFLLLCSIVLLPLGNVYSQWVQPSLTTFDTDIAFGGAITHNSGKVWAGTKQLYLSLDSGSSWSAVTSLSLFGTIVSIDFFDANNGLVVTFEGGAYQTSDGGNSWTNTLSRGDCLSGAFGQTKDIVVVVGRSGFRGHIYVSSDGGKTFDDKIIESGGGAYHVATHHTGRICVLARNVSPTRSSYIYSSTDKGVTWVKGGLQIDLDTYSFTFGGCKGNYLFLFNEAYNEPLDVNAEVIRADLTGSNPVLSYSDSHAELTGGGAYYGKSIFIQKASVGGGLMRSTNEGLNWTSIGGPYGIYDSRLIAAINENLLLAIGHDGRIWRTTNAGGFPVAYDVPQFSFIPPSASSVSVCDSGSLLRAIFRISTTCSDQKLHVVSETFSGLHPQFFSLASEAPPFIVDGNVNSTIAVDFTSPNEPGEYSSVLNLTGYYRDVYGNQVPFDTTIQLLVTVTPTPPEVVASLSNVEFKPLSPCDNKVDTVITLTNTGCDTLSILSGPADLPSGFTVEQLQFPITLSPGSSISIRFSLAPENIGNYAMSGVFEAEANGLTKSLTITLSGSMRGLTPQLFTSDSSIAFQSMTDCDLPLDTTILVTNIGCDTLFILSGPGSLGPGFTIDPLSYPIIVPPGQSIAIIVHFDAPGSGTFTADAIYISDAGGITTELRIDLSGIGTAVPPPHSGSRTTPPPRR